MASSSTFPIRRSSRALFTVLLIKLVAGAGLLAQSVTGLIPHSLSVSRDLQAEKRVSPTPAAQLSPLPCDGPNRLLFRGICHETLRGDASIDSQTGVLSVSTIDSSGIGELVGTLELSVHDVDHPPLGSSRVDSGLWQLRNSKHRSRVGVGGLRRSFAEAPSLANPGARFEWLIEGGFTETRGGTELGISSWESSLELREEAGILKLDTALVPLDTQVNSTTICPPMGCSLEIQVFADGVPMAVFPAAPGEPVRLPPQAALQKVAWIGPEPPAAEGVLARTGEGSWESGWAAGSSFQPVVLDVFFKGSIPFGIPTPEGPQTAFGDELRFTYRIPRQLAVWVKSDRLRTFRGISSTFETLLFSLDELAVQVFDTFHEVQRGSLVASFPGGPLAVRTTPLITGRQTAQSFSRLSRAAELFSEFPNVQSVNVETRPLRLRGGQFLRFRLLPFGSVLTVARSPRGENILVPDFPGAQEVQVVLETGPEGVVVGQTTVENGEALVLPDVGTLSWIDWAGHSDFMGTAAFEVTGLDPSRRIFRLRFTADIAASTPIQQSSFLLGETYCEGLACRGGGVNGFVFMKVTVE